MKNLFLFFILLMSIKVIAQQNAQLLIPYLDGQKYGFADEQGKLVIAAKYDLVYPFFGAYELTMVVNEGKAFIINRKGKKVIESTTDYLSEKEILSFNRVYGFDSGELSVDSYCLKDSCAEFNLIDEPACDEIFDKISASYFVKSNAKVFLIDIKGRPQTKKYDVITHTQGGEIEYAITEDTTLKKYGLINNEGKEILECVYERISYAGKGVFDITQSGQTHQYKTAYKEYTPKNEQLKKIDKNRIITRKQGKFGIIDSLKNVLIAFEYDKFYPMANDSYLFLKGDSVGILNIGKGIIFKAKVDKDGKHEHPFYEPFAENMAFLVNENHWNLVNLNGQILIKDIDGIDIDYQHVTSGIAGISSNGKMGIVDKNGKIVLPMIYEKIYCVSNNSTYIVTKDKHLSWLDSKGLPIYENFDDFRYILAKYLLVKKDNHWFFVNEKGLAFAKFPSK